MVVVEPELKVVWEFAAAWFEVDDIDLINVLEVELDTLSAAGRKNPFSKAHHASVLKSPQPQCHSVAHCDNIEVPIADPPSFFFLRKNISSYPFIL